MKMSNYVLMCKNAHEIQKELVNYLDDALFYYENQDGSNKLSNQNFDSKDFEKKIWLPRQSQIQDIILKDGVYDNITLIKRFEEFCNRTNMDYKHHPILLFSTFDELWLVFVIYRMYNKIWDFVLDKWIQL